MTHKKKVLVLTGGVSSEREISIKTGKTICESIPNDKYEIIVVEVQTSKNWLLQPEKKVLNIDDYFKKEKIDVVIIAMHGKYGEDGTVQAILDHYNIPYIGSGVLASAISMDKYRSKLIFKGLGLLTPSFLQMDGERFSSQNINKIIQEVNDNLKFPCIVKNSNGGSSIGIKLVANPKELKDCLSEFSKEKTVIVIEEFIKGREFTICILDEKSNKIPYALPIIEICSKNTWFDYESKYNADLAQEIVPAIIPDTLKEKLQNIGVTVFKTLGCKSLARIDVIVKDDDVYLLEVNSLPGLTKTSLFPKAAKAAGISFSELLCRLINSRIEK